MIGNPSPWHQAGPEQLACPGHDPATCPLCAAAATPAYLAGQTAAREAAADAIEA